MKKILTILIMALTTLSAVEAQNNSQKAGQLAIAPYLPADEGDAQTRSLLLDKLRQMVTKAGLGSVDLSERFVITAHVQPLRSEQTATIPQRTSVQLSVTLYVGNAADGTLYASHNLEVRGIGTTQEAASLNAIRKVNPANADIQAMLSESKRRIETFYQESGASIIQAAKGLGTAGSYGEAVEVLLAMPPSCPQYGEAQQLIGQYGAKYLEQLAQELKEQRARDEARQQREHEEFLAMLETEQARLAKQKAEAERDAIVADAVARVAVARYNSRPRRVYHIHWW